MTLNPDQALEPGAIHFVPGEKYATNSRQWQGIPGIERARNGRLWATWYSGGTTEGPDNYVLLVTSDDDGKSWSEPVLTIDPPDQIRAFDPVLWIDPTGKLWLFWAQSKDRGKHNFFDGRAGVFAISTDNPGDATPIWTQPRRLSHGIMMNKPLVRSNGEWLLPVALWGHFQEDHPDVPAEMRTSFAVVSNDEGQTWQRRGGGVAIENRHFDENMLIERNDGQLWMLVRLREGIGQSFSGDGGLTWSVGEKTGWTQPNSRFFIRRLQSGNLLLVKHHNFNGRSHLTALLSPDDGQTWDSELLLDERTDVSYPDGVQADDGRIFVIYDRERHGAKEILMAVFRESDVEAGQVSAPDSRVKVVINKIG